MKTLDNFKKAYLTKSQELEIWEEAQQVLSDYNYFQEFMRRNKTRSFDFTPTLTISRNINGWFLEKVWSNSQLTWNQRNIERLLYIYKITKSMLESDEPEIQDLQNWADFLDEQFDIQLRENLYCFVGCSHQMDQIEKLWVEANNKNFLIKPPKNNK